MENILEILGRPSIGLVIHPKRMENILEILGRPPNGLVICPKRMESILVILGRTPNESGEKLSMDGAYYWG